jgi:tRNA modification GTPase
VDTAGIRKPQNAIEKEGIDLVWENLANADLVIIILDVSKPLTNEDKKIIDRNKDDNVFIAINKIDLSPSWEIKKIERLIPRGKKILKISAKFGTGLEELKDTIVDVVSNSMEKNNGEVMISNLRHKLALENVQKKIQAAKNSISEGLSPEFAAFELREAMDHLDEITGKKINDDILDKIFAGFCIGK